MTADYKIIDKKQQCDINKESPKISWWLWDKIDKFEYLTSEEISCLVIKGK